jgi:PAS domain S-box-containing protein
VTSNKIIADGAPRTPSTPPLDAFAIPAAVFDQNGILLSCNAAFEALSGYAAVEGMRLGLLQIQHEDGVLEDLFEVASTMEFPARGNASLTRADTVVLEVAWTLGLWSAGAEEPPYLVLTATDVTDEKCLACKIKHSRDKYREAFDEQTELVCRFDPDTTIRFVNDAYAQAFGRSPRQLIGRRLVDLIAPQDAHDFAAYLATFTRTDNIRDGEESFELAAGIRAHQWWRRRAIFDLQGRLVAFQSVGRDITGLKQEQAAAARVARIVEASPVIGLRLRYSPGWPIEYVTENVERLTGWTPQALTSGSLSATKILHPADRDMVIGQLRAHVKAASGGAALKTPEALRQVFRLLTRNAAVRWVEASIMVERDHHGHVTHLEALISDVTPFVMAQNKIEASERRLLDFAEAANDWFWEMGPDLRFSWISKRASENRPFDFSHVIGRHRRDIAQIEDQIAWDQHESDLRQRRPFRDFRFSLTLPNGTLRRVSVSGRPFFAADGTFQGYRGTSTDVTREERTEAALDTTHQNYRSIFHASEVGLWDFNLQSISRLTADSSEQERKQALGEVTINGVNRAALEQVGIHADSALVGRSLHDLSSLKALFSPLFDRYHAPSGEVLRCDVPWKSSHGMRHLLMLFRPPQVQGQAGRSRAPDSAVVSVLDITDRVVVEEQLRDSEGRFRSMFEHSVPGMALIGTDGRWLRVNPSLCRMFGTSEHDLFALSLFDLLPAAERQIAMEWMAKAINGGATVRTAEQRLIRPDGGDLWAHFSMVLLRDSKGLPLYFIGQAVDITTRKNAETRATKAEAQLREAIAAMDDGFVLFDRNDRLVSWNDRFYGLYDTIADAIKEGVSYASLAKAVLEQGHYAPPAFDIDELLRQRAQLKADDPSSIRTRALADGRWLEIKETRTPDGGVVCISTDITQQKAREDALRQAMEKARLADRAKSEFLANMSHELRTPLNAIIGFSEILWQELFGPLGNPVYREYAEGIHDSGRHLLQIIGDILDLSKIEAGELDLDLEPIHVPNLVESAIRMVRARAEARRVHIDILLDDSVPQILADELRIKQVLINVLSNAVKFTESDKTIRLWSESSHGYPLTLIVEDQGIGMSEEEIKIACSMFGQVQSAFSRKLQGTGLGLPICIKLMEAHKGHLDIVSEKGVGTRVLLHFSALSLFQ